MRSISLALAVTLLSGCGGGTKPGEPPRSAMPVDRTGAPSGIDSTPLTAAVDRLLGPWLHAPIDLAPEALVAIGQACWTLKDLPGQMVIVVVDARGGGSADAYLASADGALVTCIGLQIDPSGTVGDLTTGTSWEPGRPWPTVGPHEVDVAEGIRIVEPRDEYHIAGPVGSEIAEVRLTADGRESIRATVMGGWFAVWIPGGGARYTLRGYDANGVEVFANGDY